MKNRKSIFAFFAICAAMIFASCSNIVDANVSSSSEDKNTLNIEVTNYDEVVTQTSKSANRASRTIIPDSFDSDGVDFYLYGTNLLAELLDLQKWILRELQRLQEVLQRLSEQ